MRATGAYVIRAAGSADFAALRALKAQVGPGFTSLAISDDTLAAQLQASEAAFAASVTEPGGERYFVVLEHLPTGAVVGMAQVKSCIGRAQPFFNFRILRIAQASRAANRRFDLEVLILVDECTGAAEVGSLFVHPDHRAGGVGRALAQARYMLIAADRNRFADRVVAELRGVVDGQGVSPFWEHLGRHFFQMPFAEADALSATTDNQFILDLMPKYPIYLDLLPAEARAVLGRCHSEGEAARRLLEREGFRFDQVVDIFDGGPLLICPRDGVRTVREARVATLRAGRPGGAGLVARRGVAEFRCAPTALALEDGQAVVPEATLRALKLAAGDEALVWEAAL